MERNGMSNHLTRFVFFGPGSKLDSRTTAACVFLFCYFFPWRPFSGLRRLVFWNPQLEIYRRFRFQLPLFPSDQHLSIKVAIERSRRGDRRAVPWLDGGKKIVLLENCPFFRQGNLAGQSYLFSPDPRSLSNAPFTEEGRMKPIIRLY